MTEATILHCESCGQTFAGVRHRKARWAATGAGFVVGAATTKSFLGALLIGGMTYGAILAIDRFVLMRRCPRCGALGTPIDASAGRARREQRGNGASHPDITGMG